MIRRPRVLKLPADNLQLDTMIDYYQTTGPIYAEAFASPQRGHNAEHRRQAAGHRDRNGTRRLVVSIPNPPPSCPEAV
jgi:hypothetical protein